MPHPLPPRDTDLRFRRVVTGVGPDGRSCVVSDGPVPEGAAWTEPGTGRGADPWIVESLPVDLAELADPTAHYVLQEWPSPGGAIARVISWEPGFAYPLHRSETLDVGWVLAGRVELILEDSSVELAAGDTIVQRGTMHGWKVLGDSPAILACVLLDATHDVQSHP